MSLLMVDTARSHEPRPRDVSCALKYPKSRAKAAVTCLHKLNKPLFPFIGGLSPVYLEQILACETQGEIRDGYLEFFSSGSNISNPWMDCIYFMVHQLLPTSDPQLPSKEMIPVAANDVAFSTHAVLLTAVTLFQIAIYERGSQKFSKVSIAIVCAVGLVAAVCFFMALPSHSWLWFISIFNSIQVFMTAIKYIPQAIMNFLRKSTDGFSIGNILLDFFGGMTNYAQMAVQSIDQNSWINFYGNIGKAMISLLSIFFDVLFMVQHYILYPAKRTVIHPKINKDGSEPLIQSSNEPRLQPDNV
ncbi:hypothetical protein K2173_013791 [Erythroxylum novogranatense]|uniref:Cystinosin homolog n=1 Tax=Erythroxylum novogranatense TaxID=1862640 RepID=A0AAV8SCC8_9ROSI|nr:hypothetical protein K2173_013791 [Erythroxylum novogranatense]